MNVGIACGDPMPRVMRVDVVCLRRFVLAILSGRVHLLGFCSCICCSGTYSPFMEVSECCAVRYRQCGWHPMGRHRCQCRKRNLGSEQRTGSIGRGPPSPGPIIMERTELRPIVYLKSNIDDNAKSIISTTRSILRIPFLSRQADSPLILLLPRKIRADQRLLIEQPQPLVNSSVLHPQLLSSHADCPTL